MEGEQFLRSDAAAHFHWGEGNKYVIEGGKSLFWANGAAAIGMLTFLGSSKEPITCGLRVALVLFSFGSLSAAVLFMTAYMAQLNYGKGKQELPRAERWHFVGYFPAGASVVFFAAAVIVAALSL